MKSIPACVKHYGVPYMSKYVSEQMMRLQAHHFQWEDEPLEVLLKKYPKCIDSSVMVVQCILYKGRKFDLEIQRANRTSTFSTGSALFSYLCYL